MNRNSEFLKSTEFFSSSLLWIENENGVKEFKNSSLCFLFIENTEISDNRGSKYNRLSLKDDVQYESIRTKCISHSLESTLVETRKTHQVSHTIVNKKTLKILLICQQLIEELNYLNQDKLRVKILDQSSHLVIDLDRIYTLN